MKQGRPQKLRANYFQTVLIIYKHQTFLPTIAVGLCVFLSSCSVSRDMRFSTIAYSPAYSTIYIINPTSADTSCIGVAFTPASEGFVTGLKESVGSMTSFYHKDKNPRFEVTCYVHSRDGIYRNLPSSLTPNSQEHTIWFEGKNDETSFGYIWLSPVQVKNTTSVSLLARQPKTNSIVVLWSKPDSVTVHYREPHKKEPVKYEFFGPG